MFRDETDARLGDYAAVGFGTSVAIADMDGDGALDVVKSSVQTAVFPWNDIGQFILFNDGNGVFLDIPFAALPTRFPSMHEVGDLNGDGRPDVFHVEDLADRVSLSLGPQDGLRVSFERIELTGIARTASVGGNLHLVDVDHDGDLDAGVGPVDVDFENCEGPLAGEFALLLNDGAGGFADPYAGETRPWHARPHDFAFADVDRDGDIDLFMALCEGYALFLQQGHVLFERQDRIPRP